MVNTQYIYRWCIIEFYTWNLLILLNSITPVNFFWKTRRKKRRKGWLNKTNIHEWSKSSIGNIILAISNYLDLKKWSGQRAEKDILRAAIWNNQKYVMLWQQGKLGCSQLTPPFPAHNQGQSYAASVFIYPALGEVPMTKLNLSLSLSVSF